MVADDPVVPWWLRIAVFCLLGGILVVLLTVVLEQRAHKASVEEPLPTESDRTVLLLNSDVLPGREITEILGLCGGHGTPKLLTFLRASTLGGKPLEAEIPEPFSLRLAPWVFEPDRLEDAVPVRAIPDRAYPDQEALSDAIAQAAVAEQPILIKPL